MTDEKVKDFSRSDVELLESEVRYKGFFEMRRYQLRHRLFAGGWSEPMSRELFERGHAAMVLPYDPLRDEIVVLKQFRIGALEAEGGPWLDEFVAGMIEPGESAGEVARREMEEEAGCQVRALEFICEYLVSPGGTSERVSLYCGQVDSSDVGGIHGLDHEHEDILVSVVSFDEACEMLADGRFNSAAPIIAMQWLMVNRERLRRQWCD